MSYMDLKNISEIVLAIPGILLYFVPGFIGVWLLCYLRQIKLPEHYAVFALTISYIIALFCQNPFINIGIIVAAVIVLHAIVTCIPVKNLLKDAVGISPEQSMWNDIIDYETGTYVIVQPRNSAHYYSGIYCRQNIDENCQLFAIRSFKEYDGNNKVVDDQPEQVIVFPMDAVSSITLGYPEDSKVKHYLIK